MEASGGALNKLGGLFRDRYFIALIIIMVIGAVLRFYRISFQSLWIDEGATYYYVLNDVFGILTQTEQTPPPFYIIEHYSYVLLGHSELSLRLPAALFGIASIPAIYFLGKEIHSKNVGLLAAVALALSPFHIWYSQTARPYAFMLFFFILFLIFFIRAYRSGGRKDWLIAGILAAVTFYFHFYMILFIGLAAVFFLVWNKYVPSDRRPDEMKNAIRGFIAFLILSIPLFFMMAWYALRHLAIYSDAYADCWNHGLDYGYMTLYNIFYGNVISLLIFAAVILFCSYCMIKQGKDRANYFMVFLGAVPIIVLTGMSFYFGMDSRYSFFLIPVYYILFGSILKYAPSKIDKRIVAAVAVGFLAVSCAVIMPTQYTEYDKADFRGAGEALYAATSPGDTVIYLPPVKDTMYGPLSFYYDNTQDGTIITTATWVGDLEEKISDAVAGGGDVFLVICYQNGWGVKQYEGWLADKAEPPLFQGYEISVFKVDKSKI